nr:hypothetical protein [Propioniciclava soli]
MLSTGAVCVALGGITTLTAAPAGATNPVPAVATTAQADATASELVDSRLAGELASRSSDRTDPAAAADARSAQLTATAQAIADREAAIEAERQAEIDRQAAERAAFIATQGYTPETTEPKEIARQIAANSYGWGEDQFTCYNNIIMRESMWDTFADNPTSSAYGIPQALPGSKMASEGADWETNPATQIKWGLKYVKERFGTPCSAWSFKQANGWY